MAASKPTSQLSMTIDTFHPLTLNQYFGTLTEVGVVPLAGCELTPAPPSPEVFDVKIFGVGRRIEGFPLLNSKSVSLPF